MHLTRLFILYLLAVSLSCRGHDDSVSGDTDSLPEYDEWAGKGALLLTRFSSLEEFKEVVQVQYAGDLSDAKDNGRCKAQVLLTYKSGGRVVTSFLKDGISQADFIRASKGDIADRVRLGLKCPYAVINKKSLEIIEKLGRRRPWDFGKGDVAFYDLAEAMVKNIREEDRLYMSFEDLSEKGYLNTFNHITAQAFMTSLFSRQLADFVADLHELHNMPELVTGSFTEAQLADFVNGPVDNYIDMINNEWGQKLGSDLRKQYGIRHGTKWTAVLLASYLNEIQRYHSWAFQIGFKPFKDTDEVVLQFTKKINSMILG